MKLSEHLTNFYKQYHIPANGGVNDKTFEVPLPFFTLKLPNYRWRKNMLHIHDIEHILHKQDTTWAGEVFIASWEISTGFYRNFPIIIFPLWTMGFGCWYRPKAMYNGFKKGNNDIGVARLSFSASQLLDMSLNDLSQMTLNRRKSKGFILTKLRFSFWFVLSQLVFLFPILLLNLVIFLL